MYCPQLYHGGGINSQQRALPWSLVFLPRAGVQPLFSARAEAKSGGRKVLADVPRARAEREILIHPCRRRHCGRRRRAPSAELDIGSVHIDIARRVTIITLSSRRLPR